MEKLREEKHRLAHSTRTPVLVGPTDYDIMEGCHEAAKAMGHENGMATFALVSWAGMEPEALSEAAEGVIARSERAILVGFDGAEIHRGVIQAALQILREGRDVIVAARAPGVLSPDPVHGMIDPRFWLLEV